MRKILAVLVVLAQILCTQNSNSSLDSENSEFSTAAQQQDFDALSNLRIVDGGDEFEGFITFKEYGKNLYENPRGIGCNKCHGVNGEGGVIAKYSHKGVQKTLSAPNIKKLDFAQFTKVLNKKKTGVMPNYYLTNREIEAIYNYVYE